MAELLVKAVSATHSDPVTDARGCYKVGDPVLVMPDGHPWGAEEGLPKFWIVKVPGATVAQLADYVVSVWNIRRCRWFVNTALIPTNVRNTLTSTGTITVTLAQVQSYLTDKGLV